MSVTNPDPGDDITTSGGAYVGGNVQPGGAFIGRDYVVFNGSPPAALPLLWVNVPPKPSQPLVGREAMLDDLVTRLLSGHSSALSTDGLPGAGKTALAVAVVHDARVQVHFTGGVLWGGLGTSPDPGTIVNQWAVAAGVDLSDLPDLSGRVQRLSAVLASRKLLVILDDAWDSDAPRLLRLGCPHAVHLLTTRSREVARTFAGAGQQVHVPELAPDPALQLLHQLAPEACAADPAAAAHLADAVGGLPLALELLGGYLAVPERSLFSDLSAQAFAELADPQRRLALAQARLGDVTGRVQTLQETIQLSLAELSRSNPAALAVFHALGAFAPKPAHFDRAAAAAVAGADSAALALLIKLNLVEMDNDGRLALHQVIADAACTHMPQDAADRHDAWYRRIVEEDKDNWQQIQSVYDQVRWALEKTATDGRERLLPWFHALSVFWGNQGLSSENTYWARQALTYARECDDTAAVAELLDNLGKVYSVLGDKQQALAYFEQALPLRRQAGDKSGEAYTLTNIGAVYSDLGDKQQALAYYEQALPLRCQVDDKGGEAATLNNIGLVYTDLGGKEQALTYYEQALSLMRQVGNKGSEAVTLNNIGKVYSDLGDQQQALAYYEQALPLRRQVGDRGGEAATLNNIGVAYSALRDQQQALACYEQALPLMRQVGDKGGEAATLNNIGEAYSDLGDKEQALAYCKQALSLMRQVGDKRNEATTLNNIGVVYSALGNKQQALAYCEQALPLTCQVGDKDGEATTLNNIGAIYSDMGDQRRALAYYEQALPLKRQVGDKSGESATRYNIAMAAIALGNSNRAVFEMEIVVHLDKAIHHPDLTSHQRVLDGLRRRRKGR